MDPSIVHGISQDGNVPLHRYRGLYALAASYVHGREFRIGHAFTSYPIGLQPT